jgi:hypothetical protein
MPFSFEFDAAIAVHKIWLRHLDFSVAGIETRHIDLDAAGDAVSCSLGHWIAGAGQDFTGLHNFAHLVETHQLFHAAAADVVQHWRNGHPEEAESLLKGRLADLSVELVLLIEAMKREYHTALGG